MHFPVLWRSIKEKQRRTNRDNVEETWGTGQLTKAIGVSKTARLQESSYIANTHSQYKRVKRTRRYSTMRLPERLERPWNHKPRNQLRSRHGLPSDSTFIDERTSRLDFFEKRTSTKEICAHLTPPKRTRATPSISENTWVVERPNAQDQVCPGGMHWTIE